MKKVLLPAAILAVAGLVVMPGTNLGRAQGQGGYGPGPGGAVLRNPYEVTPASPASNPPGSVSPRSDVPLFAQPNPVLPGAGQNPPGNFSGQGLMPPQEGPDPNQDILVTTREGPWMVFVHWYSGPEAPKMAREFVTELRNHYKLPAFVFNRGAEERKKEHERVKGIIEKQREFLKKNNLPLDHPIHVKTLRVEEQCAVLVGGYKDEGSARRALDSIRKLEPPNPARVKMHMKYYGEDEDPNTRKFKKVEMACINPFSKAFVARNPAIKMEQVDDAAKVSEDLEIFKKLNRDESYSLLTCKKPFTLAIKQFYTPMIVQSQFAKGNFLENLAGMGSKSTDRVDTAAVNAHNMADLLRKAKLEAYVLHTKCASIVTVGGFNGPDDPALRSTQRLLVDQYRVPQAMPMQVPGSR